MALDDQISALATAIGTKVKTKQDKVATTDNAIIRANGTSGDIQGSSAYIDDYGGINTASYVTAGVGLKGNLILDNGKTINANNSVDTVGAFFKADEGLAGFDSTARGFIIENVIPTGLDVLNDPFTGLTVKDINTGYETSVVDSGVILQSPNGNKHKVTVADSGTLKVDDVAISGGSGGTQNVFIQSTAPNIDIGTSALWIQKSLDGSITFNLVEN